MFHGRADSPGGEVEIRGLVYVDLCYEIGSDGGENRTCGLLRKPEAARR